MFTAYRAKNWVSSQQVYTLYIQSVYVWEIFIDFYILEITTESWIDPYEAKQNLHNPL